MVSAMPLALGVHIGQQNLSMDEMRALWTRCDEAGVDWISVWDHLYEAPPAGGTAPHFEAVATLAALACDTTNARIGCLVFCTQYRSPGVLAKVATTLDHLSDGRFELGLGAGWHDQEAKAYGIDFPSVGKRLSALEESTQIIKSMLSNERTTFSGEYFSVEDASCLPPPVNGHLPIWIGGVGEKRTLRMAARYGDGWNAAYITPKEFKRLSGVLDEWCEKEGRDPAEIERGVNLQFLMGIDDADSAKEMEQFRATWGPMAERLAGGLLVGSAAQATERILEYRDAGADMVNVAFRAPLVPEAVETYLTEVIPSVRSAQ
jgi:F420-dependent oxidoreductase-like protein